MIVAGLVLLPRAAAAANYYAVLGVDKHATSDAIKTAYRRLALQCHPDKQRDKKKQSDDTFKDISEAYECLSDPQRRRQYDLQQRFGSSFGNSASKSPQAPFGGGGGGGFGGSAFYTQPHFRTWAAPRDFGMSRQVAPPPRAIRPFYCNLAELSDGSKREFRLQDGPIARVRDAVNDGFKGPAGEALWRTASIATSVCWRFSRLVFSRRWWYVRWPMLCAAFLAALAQQLPRSPSGSFAFDVRAGWRQGTKIVFAAKDSLAERAVAFELKERPHKTIRRAARHGDLLWRGKASFRRARAGTILRVSDVHGHVHKLSLRLTQREIDERHETVSRQVGHGLGLPRKRQSPDEQSERGELWARVRLTGVPLAAHGGASQGDEIEDGAAHAAS